MKIKVVRKNGKYRKKISLDVDEWIAILLLLSMVVIAVIQFILWS